MTSIFPTKLLRTACVASVIMGLLFDGSVQAAQMVIQPTVTAYSSYSGSQLPNNTVNGIGLMDGGSGILGSSDTWADGDVNNMWATATNDVNPYITYDLGIMGDLKITRIWDYAGNAGASTILVSTSLDGTNFTMLTNVSPTAVGADSAWIAAQDFATLATQIRYVKLQILGCYDGDIFWSSITGSSNAGGDGVYQTGLAEVRFELDVTAPIITTQPQTTTPMALGSSVTFTVVAGDNGYGPMTYQWRKNGVNLSDSGNISGSHTATLTVNNVSLSDRAYYDVVVVNTKAWANSKPALLEVVGDILPATIHAFSSYYNSSPYFRNVTNLVQNNFVSGEQGLSGPGYATDTHDNLQDDIWHHASGDNNPYVTFDLGGYHDLLLTRIWNLNQAGSMENGAKNVRISVSIDGVTFTVLNTVTLVEAGGTPTEPAQDFPTPCTGIRFVKLEPLDGYGGGWNGLSAVRFEGNSSSVLPPTITTQPVGWTNRIGNTATFTVAATDGGRPPLTYQWQKDGTNIVGATTPSLTVANITLASAGNYSVIVSNANGAISSEMAPLLPVVLQFSLALRAGGTLITPNISDFSTYYNGGKYVRNVTNLVMNNFVTLFNSPVNPGDSTNEYGLTGPGYSTDTHDDGEDDVWHSASGDASQYVTLDLGGSYNLLITRIWNLNQSNGDWLNRGLDCINGTKDLRISVSADNVSFTILGTNTLSQGPGYTSAPAQDLSTPAAAIRYVKLEPLSNYGGDFTGLGAVRFVVAGAEKPLLLDGGLQGTPDLHYQIQYNNQLGGTNTWQVMDDIQKLPGASSTFPLFDATAPSAQAQGFYRAVWVP